MTNKKPHILIVGGGFAGLNCAKALTDAPVRVTLVDRQNHHLFQPLLYQVATAALSPADIASPIRSILRNQANVRVGMADLQGVDLKRKRASFAAGEVSYDYLVLAAGATHSYFGNDHWSAFAPGLKSIDDALDIRRRVLLAYEAAEWEDDLQSRQAKLTFIVIGGGPTGVELAGALQEIAAQTITRDFRHIDTTTAKVVLIQATDRLLEALPEKLSQRALEDLQKMGVEVRLNSMVTDVGDGYVSVGDETLPAANIIWAAGVRGAPVAASLSVECDRSGRVKVNADLSVPGHPEVFVIGDLAHIIDPATDEPVPGVAPAAMQMGHFTAEIIANETRGTGAKRKSFVYHDKGSMATIGRNHAVAAVGGRNFGGFFAWLLWGVVHIYTLIGFRRRLFVVLAWFWSYFSFGKSARLITGSHQVDIKKTRGVLPPENKD